jgi:hypothetical protein
VTRLLGVDADDDIPCEHELPAKPSKQSHCPVSVLHIPLLEHTAGVCAVATEEPRDAHDMLESHVPGMQAHKESGARQLSWRLMTEHCTNDQCALAGLKRGRGRGSSPALLCTVTRTFRAIVALEAREALTPRVLVADPSLAARIRAAGQRRGELQRKGQR